MALFVYTDDPQGLLRTMRDAIENGEIKTWSYEHINRFTYITDQYKGKIGYFEPKTFLEKGYIRFKFITLSKVNTKKDDFGIFHGRFVQMLMNHFSEKIQRISIRSKPVEGMDIVGANFDFKTNTWKDSKRKSQK